MDDIAQRIQSHMPASALSLAGLSLLPAWAAAERIIMCEDAA